MSASQSDVPRRPLPDVSDDVMASEEVGFALDLTQQIEQLRSRSGLTQTDLAQMVGTHQQQISLLENPEHQASVRMLRKVAHALRAYLDITLVPHECLERYFRRRYQPVLHDQPDPLPAVFQATGLAATNQQAGSRLDVRGVHQFHRGPARSLLAPASSDIPVSVSA